MANFSYHYTTDTLNHNLQAANCNHYKNYELQRRILSSESPAVISRPSVYIQNLEHILCSISIDHFNPSTVYQLTKSFPIAPNPYFHDEIYGLIPIRQYSFKHTLILYRDYVMHVELTPIKIIEQLLKESTFLQYDSFNVALKELLSSKSSTVPFANNHYSLIALGSARINDTIWINPGQLSAILDEDITTLLFLTNRICISSDYRRRSLLKRIHKGFLAHAILKRENDLKSVRPTTNLLEYLELPSTNITRKILVKLQYQNIPHLRGDFYKRYSEANMRRIKKKLLEDLDIEE